MERRESGNSTRCVNYSPSWHWIPPPVHLTQLPRSHPSYVGTMAKKGEANFFGAGGGWKHRIFTLGSQMLIWKVRGHSHAHDLESGIEYTGGSHSTHGMTLRSAVMLCGRRRYASMTGKRDSRETHARTSEMKGCMNTHMKIHTHAGNYGWANAWQDASGKS